MGRRSTFVLLLAVLVLGCQGFVDKNALRGTSDAAVDPTEQRRELISFWALLFEILPHPPCGPGPLHHHHCNSTGDNTDEDSNGNTNGNNQGNNGDGGEGGDSSAYYNGEESSSSTSGTSVSGAGGNGMSRSVPYFMIVAAVAATAALAAAVVGQRRDKESRHPLNGAISRRMNLFSALADGNLCGDRPPRTVEASSSEGYRMA